MSPLTRWALVAAVLLAAVAAVSLAMALRSPSAQSGALEAHASAGPTWAAGQRRAPSLGLRSPSGSPVSLAAFRGRRVIVTFTDPHCTTFCPRESLVIDDALRSLPAAERPAVVAVSVDPTVTSPAVFAQEAKRFKWLPQWRWATGTAAQLRAAWRRYDITVIPTRGDITHTEAAYVLDARGYERTLLLWPFSKRDVAQALQASSS